MTSRMPMHTVHGHNRFNTPPPHRVVRTTCFNKLENPDADPLRELPLIIVLTRPVDRE
jgi:hypothetical protein